MMRRDDRPVESILDAAIAAIEEARGKWRKGMNDRADDDLATAERLLAGARQAIPPDLTLEGRNLLEGDA